MGYHTIPRTHNISHVEYWPAQSGQLWRAGSISRKILVLSEHNLFTLKGKGTCARLSIDALWSPAGKGLTSWLSFVMSNCHFPIGILGQVCCPIVSIPDLWPICFYFRI